MKIHLLLRHNLAGKFLNHFLVFLINIMIVRMLGAGLSGDYFNELYLLNFIAFGFSMGLDFAVVRLISQEPSLAGPLRKMLLVMALVFALVMMSVLLLWPGGGGYLHQPFFAIILFCTGNLWLIIFQGWLSAMKRFNIQNVILIAYNLLFLLFIYMNRDYRGDRYQLVSVSYGLLFCIQGITMFLFCRSPEVAAGTRVDWGTLFRSGFPIMVSSLVYFAFLRIDNFFVEAYCSSRDLGNYVQCGKVGQYFMYFSSVISSSLLPFMREEGIGRSYKEWKALLKPYVLMLVAAAAGLALTGSYVFPFLFGSEFEEMHHYLLIFLPGYLALGLLTLMNVVYLGKGNVRPIFIGDISGLAIVALSDAIVVPRFGAEGAAVVSSVAYCLIALYLFAGLRRQFEMPAKDVSVSYL